MHQQQQNLDQSDIFSENTTSEKKLLNLHSEDTADLAQRLQLNKEAINEQIKEDAIGDEEFQQQQQQQQVVPAHDPNPAQVFHDSAAIDSSQLSRRRFSASSNMTVTSVTTTKTTITNTSSSQLAVKVEMKVICKCFSLD